MLARLAVAASDAGLTARAVLRFRERTNRWLSAGRRYFSLETGRASGSNRQVFEPSWKPGTGRYGETVGQMNRSGIGNIHELVLPYLDSVPVPSKRGVFTIGDYGTNDGFVSMPLFTKMIRRLREQHGDELAILVVYEDQERNDFNSLFNRLCDESSYMSEFDNVFPVATNTNFSKQCVPDGSCDVIFTSFAVHWLRDPKFTFSNAVFHFSPHVTDAELQRHQEEARRQWQQFLLLRSRELKPGGLLVILTYGLPDNYRDLVPDVDVTVGQNDTWSNMMFMRLVDDFEGAWRELREKRAITEEEYVKYMVPVALRTAKELQLPFEDVTSPVRSAGMTLEFHDQMIVPDIAKAAWLAQTPDTGHQNISYADYLATVFKTMFSVHLHGNLSDSRSDQEKQAIVDQFFDMFRDRVARCDPDTHVMNAIGSRLVVRKSFQ